ncbi:MAG: serine acetyltransferase [Armatimonadetes bacterium]|nr:serine acetyltransferase [Armatimonadota bacterium]
MAGREYIRRKADVIGRTLEEILPGYDPEDARNPIQGCAELPSEAQVLRVLSLLDDIFYPGFRSECVRGEAIEALLVERLDEAHDLLYRQVRRALPQRWKSEAARALGDDAPASLDAEEVAEEATRVVEEFFDQVPRIRVLLKKDVIAAYHGDPAARSFGEVILSYPGIRAITTHRVAHELYRLDVPLIPRVMNEYIHARTGIEIHPGARIGESFFLDHGTGVVIGETTIIGNKVRIYQGVTLGAYSFRLDEHGNPVKGTKRHPTIEDEVVIYPGATILGGDTVIGRGSVIGGNVWLTRSVPPSTTIMLKLDGSQITQVVRSR